MTARCDDNVRSLERGASSTDREGNNEGIFGSEQKGDELPELDEDGK
jgi:hypothetical protein